MTRQPKYFSASINIELGNAGAGAALKKGEIGHSGKMLSIGIEAGNIMFLKIGKVTRDEEFDSFLNEIPQSTFTIEFILVKDEEATEEKENETQEKNESETPEENKNKTIKKRRNRGLGKQWK